MAIPSAVGESSTNEPDCRQKRRREHGAPFFYASLQPSCKRQRTLTNKVPATGDQGRIAFWAQHSTWPTAVQGEAMDRYREMAQHALARRRSSSSQGITSESSQTGSSSDQKLRKQNSIYKYPLYERQMQERGSFGDDHDEGITTASQDLLKKLLNTPQIPPEHTLFSNDITFNETLSNIRGENETKMILRIAELIFPSAETRAIRGEAGLRHLRETTNAGWTKAVPFYGPRPQPAFGLGFKTAAFTKEQLQKLQPFIGNPYKDYSYIAATDDMYFPFFTSEVKCGAATLDIADRQNLHSHTVALRGLVMLFRLAGRLGKLHREIMSYSISHDDRYVRVWGHYVYVTGDEVTYHRHLISDFAISPTVEGDQRWKAWKFTRNVHDLVIPDHHERICSAIDALPIDLTRDGLGPREEQDPVQASASTPSGLAQRVSAYGMADEGVDDSQVNDEPATPDTTAAGSSNPNKTKRNT